MKLVCHIGTPKTASTFLQNTFAANRDWLLGHGVLFPELLTPHPNHITLFYAAAEKLHPFARDYGLKSRDDLAAFREKMRATIAQRIARAPKGVHTMLVSSENMGANLHSPAEIRALHDLFRPHFDEFRITVYLRRQDDAMLSMWGEHMRRGFNGKGFTQFVETCFGPRSLTRYLYYRRLLSNWSEVFGRDALDVRLFDRDHLEGGDILVDFMTILFGRRLPPMAQMTRGKADNIGLAAPVLEFLRLMYPHMPLHRDGVLNQARAELGPRINALPAAPRPRMGAGQSQEIMAHFAADNEWLQAEFFPGLPAPLFPERGEREDGGEPSNIGKLSRKQMAEYAAQLFL